MHQWKFWENMLELESLVVLADAHLGQEGGGGGWG